MQRAKRVAAEESDFLIDTIHDKSSESDGRSLPSLVLGGVSARVQALPRNVDKLPRKHQLAHLAAGSPELLG